jgi:phenylalanyl-tRNA synthetase beta chain
MKVSYHWLKDYLNFDKSPEEVADILTKTGLEVENIEPVGSVKGGLKGVVTGKIQSCEKHPDADKLKLTRVDIGNETLQIVCGASNVAEGQIVLVALVGTTLFPITGEPITLRKAKIRGVESHGMICAEDELGLGTSHEGIMVLPSDTPVGIPAAEALKLDNDFILEIGLTPNRCDAMGHYGVARDLRAYLNHHEALNQALTPFNSPEFAHEPISKVQFEVSNDTGCTAYYAAVIKGVKISTESNPIGQRLEKIGVSSINNVVDCANYVMHEFGTPLHAFDARFFKHKLDVRFAEKGEELVTLDGATRKLTSNDVVIAGDGKAHCLAGVMGGKESGV